MPTSENSTKSKRIGDNTQLCLTPFGCRKLGWVNNIDTLILHYCAKPLVHCTSLQAKSATWTVSRVEYILQWRLQHWSNHKNVHVLLNSFAPPYHLHVTSSDLVAHLHQELFKRWRRWRLSANSARTSEQSVFNEIHSNQALRTPWKV